MGLCHLSPDITAVVEPLVQLLLYNKHAFTLHVISVCLQENSSYSGRTEVQDGEGRSEDCQQGLGG